MHIDVLVTAATRLHRNNVPVLPFELLIGEPFTFKPFVEPILAGNGEVVDWRPSRTSFGARFTWIGFEDLLGRGLWLENARAIRTRYADAEEASGEALNAMRTYAWTEQKRSAVHVIKQCDCYSYQTSELPDWEASWAKRAAAAIREAAIGALPGYEEAPWGEGE
jgi:hypothetical protein